MARDRSRGLTARPILYSYVMRSDTGFAPHVDAKCAYLSLACCKPDIRNSAQRQDWVLGFGGRELSKKTGKNVVSRLIFAAKVSETLTFDSYYTESKFMGRVDNIYHSVDSKGTKWLQVSNSYHDESNVKKDTKANSVLVSDHFLYFGPGGPRAEEIGKEYSTLIKKGPKHKKFHLDRDEAAHKFIEHLENAFEFNRCSKPTENGKKGKCGECE